MSTKERRYLVLGTHKPTIDILDLHLLQMCTLLLYMYLLK